MNYPKNPWKDFASYSSDDSRYFKGRNESISKFLRVINSGTQSVLYASSGIGKTSFLQAGIEPYMVESGYAPFHILFTDDDFSGRENFCTILSSHIKDEVEKHNKKYADNLWKWIPVFEEQDIYKQANGSLWWKFHAYELKDADGVVLKPLLILDQFEEVFVKTKARKEVLQELFDVFEELASNNLPKVVETSFDSMASNGIFLDINTHNNYKIIFSLRKEYLPDFDYWTNDRHSIAELQQNRMLLLPLSRTQAMKVIKEQPLNAEGSECYTTLNGVADAIINVIDDKQRNEIEPFILSVLCSRLYDRAMNAGKSELKPNDLDAYYANTIIREFYEQKISSIISKHSHLTKIEEELVDEDGKRGRIQIKKLKELDFEKRYKKALEDAHLIRTDSYNGEDYIEIVHDRVADAIMDKRKEANKKSKLIFARIAAFFMLFALFFVTYWIQTWPTSHKSFPYELSMTNKGGRYINDAIETIHGTTIEAINCRNLHTIFVDSCSFSEIKVRGCSNLKNIILDKDCGIVLLDLDNCPALNPIKIPASVWSLSFGSIPPNNLTFHIEDSTHFIWKDKILWNAQNTKIVYARYDAPSNVIPPIKSEEKHFSYQTRNFNNDGLDTIILYGRDTKYHIDDSIYVLKGVEILDLRALKISSTDNWHMSKFPNLREIVLPDSLVEVSSSTFAGCVNLQHVTFPSTLRSIGREAFRGCLSLQEVEFPDSLNEISKSAFEGCVSLSEISIPDSVRIEISAFDGCTNLKTVRLPHYFEIRGRVFPPDFMFKFCPNIRNIYFDNSSNHYSVEDDSTIVYTGVERNYSVIPFLFINNVSRHSYNSDEIIIDSVLRFSYFSKNGVLYYGNRSFSKSINDPRNSIYFGIHIVNVTKGNTIVYIPLINEELFLAGALEDCKELHFPFTDENKRKILDIPSELKRNIVLYVPYGALPFFTGIGGFDESEWKGIEEENLLSWIGQIIVYHWKTGFDVVSQWQWFWPVIIMIVLVITAIMTFTIYIYRRRENGNQTKNVNLFRFVVNFLMTIVIGAFTWYTIYWFIFLTPLHFWGRTILAHMEVDAPISACLAVLFVYVVLYSKGFNLKGFFVAFRSNALALRNGLIDLYYTIKNLTWYSVRQSLKRAAVGFVLRVWETFKMLWSVCQSLKRAAAGFIIRVWETFRMLWYGIHRMFLKFCTFIRQSMYKLTVQPIRRKTLIYSSLVVIPILLSIFFAKGHEELNGDEKELVEYCNSLIKDSTITYKQVKDLRERLVRSISIKDMEIYVYDKESSFSSLGDSILIIVERDSCHYYDFARMKYSHVNFGNSTSEVHKGKYSLSESQKFIYHLYEDSVYIWPKNDLEQILFKERLTYSNEKLTWFAHDKYVGFRNGDGKYVIFDTKEWKCVAEVIGGEGKRIAQGVLVTTSGSVAQIYDDDMRLTTYIFDGKFRGCIDNKFLISQKGDMYMLYNLADGAFLDKKRSDRKYDFPDFSYGYISSWPYDSTYIMKVIDNQINFDVIPYKVEITSSKYVCYIRNDSTMIYHIPTNRTYNKGYSVKCYCQDSLVAINDKCHIAVYNVSDSIKLLRDNIPAGSSYSLDMCISNNFLTIYYTNTLFHYNADSLCNINVLNKDVRFNGWYCRSGWSNEYYSLEYYDDGSYDTGTDVISSILRGGWCFVKSEGGSFKLVNIKSTKRLIRESQYLDEQTKEDLCRLYDEYNGNNLK